MINRRRFLALSAGAMFLSGCTSGNQDNTNNNEDTNTDENSIESLEERYPNRVNIHIPTKLVVLEYKDTDINSVSISISGTVVNGSNTYYEYAQITFGLYNNEGAKVSNAVDNISGLESGQRWAFEAVGSVGDSSEWKLDNMSAY